MFKQLLQMYTSFMVTGVTSPIPHFVGPPGTGKTTMFEHLALLTGRELRVINLSRVSPLELEGVQMPIGEGSGQQLKLLLATYWDGLKDGDILLFDEMLRAFPEVFNGLIDITTSRQVAGHRLPRVFMAGASNSVVTYDSALEDRLLHIPVPDPRSDRGTWEELAGRIASGIGLHPETVTLTEMRDLMTAEVLPPFAMLDRFSGKARTAAVAGDSGPGGKGSSIRKLVGQALLRHVMSDPLRELIESNNQLAMHEGRPEYVVLLDAGHPPMGYEQKARAIKGASALTKLQAQNLEINLGMIDAAEAARKETTAV